LNPETVNKFLPFKEEESKWPRRKRLGGTGVFGNKTNSDIGDKESNFTGAESIILLT
jgi:hypothetical protein